MKTLTKLGLSTLLVASVFTANEKLGTTRIVSDVPYRGYITEQGVKTHVFDDSVRETRNGAPEVSATGNSYSFEMGKPHNVVTHKPLYFFPERIVAYEKNN
jgi:hypothetical protein